MAWGVETKRVLAPEGLNALYSHLCERYQKDWESLSERFPELLAILSGIVGTQTLQDTFKFLVLSSPRGTSLLMQELLHLGFILGREPSEFEAVYNEMIAQYGTHNVEVRKGRSKEGGR